MDELPALPSEVRSAIARLCEASQQDAIACNGFVSMANSTAHKQAMRVVRAYAAAAVAQAIEACAKLCEDDAFVDQWKGLAEAARRIRATLPQRQE